MRQRKDDFGRENPVGIFRRANHQTFIHERKYSVVGRFDYFCRIIKAPSLSPVYKHTRANKPVTA